MLQFNTTPLSARSAKWNALPLVGKIGLEKLRDAVGPTSKMRKDTLRSLGGKSRFSREWRESLSYRVVLLLGPKIDRKEIRKFALDNVRSQGSRVVASPRSFPYPPDLLPERTSRQSRLAFGAKTCDQKRTKSD